MTRISVAIATYNGGRFLQEQLDSIAAQTLSPCEVVICDDGSADDTLQVVERFARVASFPVRSLRNQVRLNYRANFMKAAQCCSGDLIAFCDQDDLWRADKLSVVANAFADPDVLLVHHNARVFSAASGVTGLLFGELRPALVSGPLCRTPFDLAPGFTQVFRRSLLPLSDLREATLDYWGPRAPLAHDQWIYILASSLGKVCYLSETLADYRQHENNLVGARRTNPSRLHGMKVRLTRLSDYGHLEIAFDAIARALAAATAYPIDEELARRAPVAAERYRELAEAYADRRQAHAAASLIARAAAWKRLWRRGRYRPGGNFFFAGHAAARDLLHGVCLARLRHAPAGLSGHDRSLILTSAC
jgi:glycosyltransferase involved in cell wall biosynthesis